MKTGGADKQKFTTFDALEALDGHRFNDNPIKLYIF